eukprot:676787_1
MQRRLYRQKVQGYGTNSHMIQDQLSNLKTNLSQTRVELSAARAQMEQHLKYDTHTTTPGLPSLSGATSNAIALAPPGMVFNTYGQFCAGPAPTESARIWNQQREDLFYKSYLYDAVVSKTVR